MISLENLILSNLVYNEDYRKKVFPYVKNEYFLETNYKVVHQIIFDYVTKYNSPPTKEALFIELNNFRGINETEFKKCNDLVESFSNDESDIKWLLDTTEKFCSEKALHNAILESIGIMDGNTKKDKGAIPSILQEALAVCFDTRLGHSYFDDWEERWEYYNKKENKIPFDLDILNEATNGGVMTKTMNVLMAGIHVGKTLSLCHFAAAYLSAGHNVLYITLEMGEEEIARRIDANLLNVEMDIVPTLPKTLFQTKITKTQAKTSGKLEIRQYPTAGASVNHFNALLNEFALKENYKPKIVIIDYLNIAASSRMKKGSSLYEYVKSIAEEVRGFSIDHDVVVWTATQLNRAGFRDSDPGLEHSSESFGLPAVADLVWVMTVSEEMAELNQILFKQEKNRYREKDKMSRFAVGVDRPKMRLFDCDASAQVDIVDEKYKPSDKMEKFKGMKFE